jgi:hypothetical protein
MKQALHENARLMGEFTDDQACAFISHGTACVL